MATQTPQAGVAYQVAPVMQQQVAYGTAPAQVVYEQQQQPAFAYAAPANLPQVSYEQVQGVTYAAPQTVFEATPMAYALPAQTTQVMEQQQLGVAYAAPQVYEAPQAVTYAAPQVQQVYEQPQAMVYAAPAQVNAMAYAAQPQQVVYYEQPQQQLSYVQPVVEQVPPQLAVSSGATGMAYMTGMQQPQSFYQPVGAGYGQPAMQAQGQYQPNFMEATQVPGSAAAMQQTTNQVGETILQEQAGTAISTKLVEEVHVPSKASKKGKKLSAKRTQKGCC